MVVKSFHLIWGHKGFKRHRGIHTPVGFTKGRAASLWNLAQEASHTQIHTPGNGHHRGMPGTSRTPGESPELLCAVPPPRMRIPGFWTVGVFCFAKRTELCTLNKGSCFVLPHPRPGDVSDQTLVHLDSSPPQWLCPPSQHNPSCCVMRAPEKPRRRRFRELPGWGLRTLPCATVPGPKPHKDRIFFVQDLALSRSSSGCC